MRLSPHSFKLLTFLALTSFVAQPSAVGNTQTSGGYVTVEIGQNPIIIGQNAELSSSVDGCADQEPPRGTVSYYFSKSSQGPWTEIEEEFGVYDTSPGTYYFYAYYTSNGEVNGVPDPCLGLTSSSPIYSTVTVEN